MRHARVYVGLRVHRYTCKAMVVIMIHEGSTENRYRNINTLNYNYNGLSCPKHKTGLRLGTWSILKNFNFLTYCQELAARYKVKAK